MAASTGALEGEVEERWQSRVLQPDFTAHALAPDEVRVQLSLFIAKATLADGSLQGAMIAAKLLLAILAHHTTHSPIGDALGLRASPVSGVHSAVGDSNAARASSIDEDGLPLEAATTVGRVASDEGPVAVEVIAEAERPIGATDSVANEKLLTLPLSPVLIAVLHKWGMPLPFKEVVEEDSAVVGNSDASESVAEVATQEDLNDTERQENSFGVAASTAGAASAERAQVDDTRIMQEYGKIENTPGGGSTEDEVEEDEEALLAKALMISLGKPEVLGNGISESIDAESNSKQCENDLRAGEVDESDPANAEAMLRLFATFFPESFDRSSDKDDSSSFYGIDISVEFILLVLFLHIDELS